MTLFIQAVCVAIFWIAWKVLITNRASLSFATTTRAGRAEGFADQSVEIAGTKEDQSGLLQRGSVSTRHDQSASDWRLTAASRQCRKLRRVDLEKEPPALREVIRPECKPSA